MTDLRYRVQPATARGAIEAAAVVLDAGGVVVFPTETFYGLAVRPDRPEAVGRLSRLKGRPSEIPVIAASREVANRWADIPLAAEPLLDAFWPGALSLVVPARRPVPAPLLGITGELAVRVSSHPVAQRLAAAAGGVITSTSANPRGASPVTATPELHQEITRAVALALDDGRTNGGLPSTIIGLDPHSGSFVLLRAGAVRAHDLGAVLGYVPELVSER